MKGDVLMKIIISGKKLELTDGIKNAIEEKIGKLERYLDLETQVKVTGLLSTWLANLQEKCNYAFTMVNATDWETYKKNVKFGRVQ